MKKKVVVIVGAGPSGLVALKEMLEKGHDATIIEKSGVIGGVFSTLRESSYDALYLTISNVFMAYSDFPCEEDYIKYSKKEEYAVYLERYAAHFGLLDRIKFNTTVEAATLEGETWRIKCSDGEVSADSLIVCTGSNQVPKKTPEIFAPFGGKVVHSSQFQNADAFKGERVLIVGTGESASDVAAEIAGVAQHATVWARRPFILAPRYTARHITKPGFDEYLCMQTEKMWRECYVGDFLECQTTSRAINALPLWMYSMVRQMGWKIMASDFSNKYLEFLGKYSRAATAYPGVDKSVYLRADQAGWVTKNSRISEMAGRGSLEVVVAQNLRVEGKTVTFSDVLVDSNGERNASPDVVNDYDTIVLCTGYTNDFDWIRTEQKLDWCPRAWFKHCWPSGFGDKLAFIGWARPHQGGIPQTSELCARFHALLLSGERELPANIAEVTKTESEAETRYYVLSPNLTSLCDWPSFASSLTAMIGCEPPVPWLVFSPSKWLKYWLYPMWPCWYRLKGPGAKPEVFDQVMDRFPVIGSKVLVDPVTLAITIPFSVVQKFFVNTMFFLFKPFSRLPGYHGFPTLYNKSKLNILHGYKMKVKSLFSFAM
ncbi:hypothetical protein CTAYLR_007632 [Chrysophaeum taylorii]|uniref:Flavin-containing monooxygenase n=1 Tax=Chrysophaeum taylorii TaxID=2483200 RepID=A0AAD7UGU7_9STRA|nr:hypothetical protein CTAYLR_007632 [Chrysophaeum taylorii]